MEYLVIWVIGFAVQVLAFIAGVILYLEVGKGRHPPVTPLGLMLFSFYLGFYINPLIEWFLFTFVGRILTYEIWRCK